MSKARIILEDGTVYEGKSFGYERSVSGEVVFNTAMTGYPESLTDPSYVGQILVMTYPLVGNYGVPERTRMPNGLSRYMESEKIHIEGLVVFDHSPGYSHWNAIDSLDQWLKEERIPGVYDIDTRALTKLLREKGSMKGKLVIGEDDPQKIPFTDPNSINQVERVSCREVITYEGIPGNKKVVLPDCGVKHNIIRCLLKRGVTVIRVPWNFDFNTIEYDGVFVSNGPGDPTMCRPTVEYLKKALEGNKPVCGICMGNQLLGLAAGGKVYKMKYGHRGHNQPVRNADTGMCYITSQNHGYALDTASLGEDWVPLYTNLNDGTNEGIRHRSKPFFTSQFHPEAASGPTDTVPIFDEFVELL
jgi:carbamoyl-phosphate synthase small subunit